MPEMHCTKCGTAIQFAASQQGQSGTCMQCGETLRLHDDDQLAKFQALRRTEPKKKGGKKKQSAGSGYDITQLAVAAGAAIIALGFLFFSMKALFFGESSADQQAARALQSAARDTEGLKYEFLDKIEDPVNSISISGNTITIECRRDYTSANKVQRTRIAKGWQRAWSEVNVGADPSQCLIKVRQFDDMIVAASQQGRGEDVVVYDQPVKDN